MACLIYASEILKDYQGKPSLFEYTNGDGEYVRTNCGQAAAATFLTFHGKLTPAPERAQEVMSDIERDHRRTTSAACSAPAVGA